MLYFLPSRLVDLVRPAMACLLIVYEVASEWGNQRRLGCWEMGGRLTRSRCVSGDTAGSQSTPALPYLSAHSPPVIDDSPALWFLRLHHPRRILRTDDSRGDVDVHDGEVVLNIEVFDGD